MSYGKAIMGYNDVEDLANELVAAQFEGYHLFDEIGIYRSLTAADLEEQLQHQMNEEYCALSVVLPGKDEEL